jgi:hypothetical protein
MSITKNEKIVLTDLPEPRDVVNCILGGAEHVMQTDRLFFEKDYQYLQNVINNQLEYFFEKKWGEIINCEGNSREHSFVDLIDKNNLFSDIKKFIGPDGHQSFHESVHSIIEEMYMNATLDAPKEASKIGHGDKKVSSAKIKLSWSGERLNISCIDFFGSLNPNKFFLRMQEVYSKGAGQVINFNRGSGAGLGCVVLFENCTDMAVGVVPGQKTIFSCVVPRNLSYRQRSSHKKNLHLISY